MKCVKVVPPEKRVFVAPATNSELRSEVFKPPGERPAFL